MLVTTQSQSEQTSDSQQDEAEEQNIAPAEPASSPKRETRGSKCRPTAKLPESTHEADVSESESCCSVASDIQLTTRSRRKATVRVKPTTGYEQDASKAESSSSSLGKTPRRSTRGQKKPVPVLESVISQEDEHSEAESCSSAASLSTRVTRSCRKPAVPEGAAHSEADSCSSVVSGPQGSTVRRSTRIRVKVTEPIPIHLEQSETAEASAALEPRGHRGKAKSVEKDQAYDSEGCQSGPSLSPRRSTRSQVADTDAESISTAYTSLDSPCSTRDRGTPCSSRTGSASSNRAVRVSRSRSVRVTLDVINMPSLASRSVTKDSEENEPEMDQADTTEDIPCPSLNASKSDTEDVEEMEEDANNKTIIAGDQQCSIAEVNNWDLILTIDEDEVVKPESRQDISSETEKNVEECQKIADETMETHEAGSVQEVQVMEDESSSMSMTPQKSVTGSEEDQANLTTGPDTEVQQSSDSAEHDKNLKILGEPEEKVEATKEMADMAAGEGAITVDHRPSEEGVMENTSNQEGSSSSSEASKVSIEKTKPVKGCVSLLDSSEDEESDDDEDDDGFSVDVDNNEAVDLESEDKMCSSEDQPGPSAAPDSLTGNGLFVIDARPGWPPRQKYYINTTENEDDDNVEDSKAAEDEDFIDEEADDDEEEDEDSKVLFATRNPALYALNFSFFLKIISYHFFFFPHSVLNLFLFFLSGMNYPVLLTQG